MMEKKFKALFIHISFKEKNNLTDNMRMTVISRSVQILSIFALAACVAASCTRKESSESKSSVTDKCNACNLNSFSVEQQTFSVGQKKIVITEPVAIQFFNRVRLADKYEREHSYDSLMKLLNLKHLNDRNVIYDLKAQYVYFVDQLKPILLTNSVKIMDSVSNDSVLEFRAANGNIIVDPNAYKDLDGVLVFTPQRKPMFWTLEAEQTNCKDNIGALEQYFLCPMEM